MQRRIYAIFITTDPLNESGDEPIEGQYFISRYRGLACTESPAWRFRNGVATDLMTVERSPPFGISASFVKRGFGDSGVTEWTLR